MLDRQNRKVGDTAYSDKIRFNHVISGISHAVSVIGEYEDIYSTTLYVEKATNCLVFLSAELGGIASMETYNNYLALEAIIGSVTLSLNTLDPDLLNAYAHTKTSHNIATLDAGEYSILIRSILFQVGGMEPSIMGYTNNIRLSIISI